jgi:hypothetical protein
MKEMILLLLSNGANALLQDGNGLSACYHIATLPPHHANHIIAAMLSLNEHNAAITEQMQKDFAAGRSFREAQDRDAAAAHNNRLLQRAAAFSQHQQLQDELIKKMEQFCINEKLNYATNLYHWDIPGTLNVHFYG